MESLKPKPLEEEDTAQIVLDLDSVTVNGKE